MSLADQGAHRCVTCHADLSQTLPAIGIDDASDFERQHPPVRLAVVVDPTLPPSREIWSPELREHSGLSFDHNLHVTQELWRSDGEEERLDCGACHVPEADGASMAPIAFDPHCRRCHELDPGEPALAGQIVHGPADRIRKQLRAFYTDRVLEGRVSDGPKALRRRRPGPLTRADERAAAVGWIVDKVAAAEQTLFEEAEAACERCHERVGGRVSPTTGEWEPRAVAPVQVARRWIEHARFAHVDHATQACAHCHPGAAVRDGDVAIEEEPDWARPGAIPYGLIEATAGVTASDRSEHVLIPGIETCRECHASEARGARPKVVSPCSACHAFHDHRLGRMAGLPNGILPAEGPDGDAGG